MPVTEPRPFLKWAGGKTATAAAVAPLLPRRLPHVLRTVSGQWRGVLRFLRLGKLRHRRAVLTDDNADLIGCYLEVRDKTTEVIAALETLARGHERHQREHYYRVRNEVFNPARREWREGGGAPSAYTPELAAMLIYLNRTGYNGLFRLNASGAFNVPAGR